MGVDFEKAGGPAFPVSDSGMTGILGLRDPGMTLRDYFAAKALQAILPVADNADARCGNEGVQASANDYARSAYCVADAMLRWREVKA